MQRVPWERVLRGGKSLNVPISKVAREVIDNILIASKMGTNITRTEASLLDLYRLGFLEGGLYATQEGLKAFAK